MESDNKFKSQLFEWMESMHKMVMGVMLTHGLLFGIIAYYVFHKWYMIPLFFVVSFIYPLAENLRRKIMRKKNGNHRSR